jgi:hypothetical protein
VLGLLLTASLALAACGSSSSSSSTSTNRASTSPAAGAASGRFSALRECLKKAGIELPQRKPGQGGGFLGTPGSGQTLPKGVTEEQLRAALKKCGGGFGGQGGFRTRLSSPAYKKALASFAKCMAQNGVTLPTPNTTGKGPVFDTGKVNTKTAQFKAADQRCASLLRFARPGGAAGAGAPGGGAAPPGTAAGEAPPALKPNGG